MTITKACEPCDGTGTVTLLGIDDDGPCEAERMCHDCDGTGRIPDIEATLLAEVERLKTREPTQAEGDSAEGRPDAAGTTWPAGHVFVDGWTGRRCIGCKRWTWGGPTRCVRCVERAEVARLRALLSEWCPP